MDALNKKWVSTIALSYPFYIRKGDTKAIPLLIQALNEYGDQNMAVTFLNSQNSALESAAESWAKNRGMTVVKSKNRSIRASWGQAGL